MEKLVRGITLTNITIMIMIIRITSKGVKDLTRSKKNRRSRGYQIVGVVCNSHDCGQMVETLV